MDKEKNKELIHTFWKNFSEKKYVEALSMLDESATWWVAGNTKLSGRYNKQDFSDLLSGVSVQAPNGIKVTPSSMTAEQNRVSMEADSYAELTNGKIYKNEYHFLFTIKGDKILKVKEYLDTEHVTEIFD